MKTPWRASSSLRQQSICICYTPTPQHCPTSTCFLRRDICCLCWRWRGLAEHRHHQSQATETAGICVENEVRRNCQRYAQCLATDAYRRLFWPLHHVQTLGVEAPTEQIAHGKATEVGVSCQNLMGGKMWQLDTFGPSAGLGTIAGGLSCSGPRHRVCLHPVAPQVPRMREGHSRHGGRAASIRCACRSCLEELTPSVHGLRRGQSYANHTPTVLDA